MSDKDIPATPVVRQLADRLGVELRNVVGTGVGGRIRRDDVVQAAGAASSATVSRRAVGNPYASAGGSLPAFTASGLDPAVLARFPAPVRPAMAAAATTAEAYRLGQAYQGLSDADAAAKLSTDTSVPENLAYQWGEANGFDYAALTQYGAGQLHDGR